MHVCACVCMCLRFLCVCSVRVRMGEALQDGSGVRWHPRGRLHCGTLRFGSRGKPACEGQALTSPQNYQEKGVGSCLQQLLQEGRGRCAPARHCSGQRDTSSGHALYRPRPRRRLRRSPGAAAVKYHLGTKTPPSLLLIILAKRHTCSDGATDALTHDIDLGEEAGSSSS
jgi:hypothetical protein